ncbi:MAG: rane fusion component of tripartite multidrug resistance system [Myxococcales bacterium]|nr:rane fusion component of tripartite multidrug resistance system [Myxococcales bacterium]
MENEPKSSPRLEPVPREVRPPAAAPTQPAAETEPPKKKRRPFVLVAIVAGLLLVGITGYMIWTHGEENTDDAQVSADVVPIGTRVAGQVTKVHVQENQIVKKGDLIAEIDPADYAARVKQAEAELASQRAQALGADAQVSVVEAGSKGGLTTARAALAGSTVSVGSAEAQLQSAKAALMRAQADARKAELDLGRARELKAANAVPQERVDNAQAANDSAQAALAQARAGISVAEEARRSAQERVGEARGRLNQSSPIEAQNAAAHAQADLAHARVQAAEAQLELAKLQLGYTKVTAPVDGNASKLSVHEGQLVAVGSPVIELVPVSTYVVANFKETQVGQMKPGQRVDIKVDAYPGKKFEGKVESLSGGTGSSFSLLPADNASGNFVKVVQRVPVRIAWTRAPDVALRAGLSADVTIHVN